MLCSDALEDRDFVSKLGQKRRQHSTVILSTNDETKPLDSVSCIEKILQFKVHQQDISTLSLNEQTLPSLKLINTREHCK